MPDKYPGPSFKLYDVPCESWFDGGGWFHVKLADGETSVTGETLEAARERMKKIILARRAKLDVKFTSISDRGAIRHGTVTGLHAGNGNPLALWDDGDKQQLTSYHGFFPRLTDEQAEEHAALSRAKIAADNAWTESRKKLRGVTPGDIYSRNEWSLDKAIKQALEGGDSNG